MSDPSSTATPTAPATAPVKPAGTLLLVDDEPSVLSALRRLYRTQGYKIEQATSAADALALMRVQPIDLVISDMRMPEMDGAALFGGGARPPPQHCAHPADRLCRHPIHSRSDQPG